MDAMLGRWSLLLCLMVGTTCGWSAEGFFDSQGVRIRYLDLGNPAGPPVLLIHGYMASADLNWRIPGVMRALERDYRIIAIDNRGHGRSDKPTGEASYGPNMAEDAVRLLDHLQLPRAHVVGYSMGGLITLYLAAHHPDRMLSAAVTGMGWLPKEDPKTEPTQGPGWVTPWLRSCLASFPAMGLTREELAEITLPMEVIIGSADHLYETRVKPFQEVRPDVPVTLIKGANHLNCMFRSEFHAAVKKFLDAQPRVTP
jgi:hypothetical protein